LLIYEKEGNINTVIVDLRKRQGVHVVEYSTAISRDDFLARLVKLEKAVAELTKK